MPLVVVCHDMCIDWCALCLLWYTEYLGAVCPCYTDTHTHTTRNTRSTSDAHKHTHEHSHVHTCPTMHSIFCRHPGARAKQDAPAPNANPTQRRGQNERNEPSLKKRRSSRSGKPNGSNKKKQRQLGSNDWQPPTAHAGPASRSACTSSHGSVCRCAFFTHFILNTFFNIMMHCPVYKAEPECFTYTFSSRASACSRPNADT